MDAIEIIKSAGEIISCLYETVLAFSESESPDDDVTAVVLKVDCGSEAIDAASTAELGDPE